MSTSYDPVADAIQFLNNRTLSERHAIARLLQTDGPALEVLHWLISQPDCDLASASMIFWRLYAIPTEEPAHRISVLKAILTGLRRYYYRDHRITWDGVEAWHGTQLIGAGPAAGIELDEEIPRDFYGPFRAANPEPATHAFLEVAYEEDDIFDSIWRVPPKYAAAADWLIGKLPEVWMAAVDEFASIHADDIYQWMVERPECPRSVAGQIFWISDPIFYARQSLESSSPVTSPLLNSILTRWRNQGYKATDLGFQEYAKSAKYKVLIGKHSSAKDPLDLPADLLSPSGGKQRTPIAMHEDFDFHCIIVNIGGLMPRPRVAALKEWENYLLRYSRPTAQPPVPTEPAPAADDNKGAGWRIVNWFRSKK